MGSTHRHPHSLGARAPPPAGNTSLSGLKKVGGWPLRLGQRQQCVRDGNSQPAQLRVLLKGEQASPDDRESSRLRIQGEAQGPEVKIPKSHTLNTLGGHCGGLGHKAPTGTGRGTGHLDMTIPTLILSRETRLPQAQASRALAPTLPAIRVAAQQEATGLGWNGEQRSQASRQLARPLGLEPWSAGEPSVAQRSPGPLQTLDRLNRCYEIQTI